MPGLISSHTDNLFKSHGTIENDDKHVAYRKVLMVLDLRYAGILIQENLGQPMQAGKLARCFFQAPPLYLTQFGPCPFPIRAGLGGNMVGN